METMTEVGAEAAVEAGTEEELAVEKEARADAKSGTGTESVPEPLSVSEEQSAARTEVKDEADGSRHGDTTAGAGDERAEEAKAATTDAREAAGGSTEDGRAGGEDPARPAMATALDGPGADVADGAMLTKPWHADGRSPAATAEVNGRGETPGAGSGPRPALGDIDDEEVLDKMLSEERDQDARARIRAARRELRKKKRGCAVPDTSSEEKEECEEQIQKGTGGTPRGTALTPRPPQGRGERDGAAPGTSGRGAQRTAVATSGGAVPTQASRTPPTGQMARTHPTPPSSGHRVGSIFDREDASPVAHAKVQSREATPRSLGGPRGLGGSQAPSRRAIVERLERQSGGQQKTASPVKLQRAGSFGATTIKQMLLEWCRAKTRGYEHVDIQNFSTSWSDGLAFCALVHHFFPDAFDFSALEPRNRRHNFDLAFTTAENEAGCPQLLDTDDMVQLREPDWKCVYTYVQELYRSLVEKGLVKTKSRS